MVECNASYQSVILFNSQSCLGQQDLQGINKADGKIGQDLLQDNLLMAFGKIESKFLQMQLTHCPIYPTEGEFASPTLFLHYLEIEN